MRYRSGLVFILALFLVAASLFGCAGSSKSASGNSKATVSTAVSSIAKTTTTSFSPGTSAAADAVAKRVAASIVMIKVPGAGVDYGFPRPNLGVVYSADGLILTSGMPTDASLEVTLPDGETVTAKVIAEDGGSVALLRINKSGLTPVRLASGKPKVGEWIALVSKNGSSLASTPASIVNSPSTPAPNSRVDSVQVKAVNWPAKWPLNPPLVFDKQGNLVGLVAGSSMIGDPHNSLSMVTANTVAAEAAKLLSGSSAGQKNVK